MKKTILLLSMLCVLINVSGQPVPNGGFENWIQLPFSEPDQWYTSNVQSIPQYGLETATEIAGFSGSAIRIETMLDGNDTVQAYMSNTSKDIIAGEGGMPYSQQPTGISGYYRYSLPGNDTAILLVIFKNGGNIISMDEIKIRGSGSQLVWSPFNYPLSLALMPDTVLIAAASSNLLEGVGVEPGSYLELDELAFTGPGITQSIPGGTFDNWTVYSIDNPTGWNNLNLHVTRSTDSYAGTYAVRLENVSDGGSVNPTGITTGQQTSSGTIGGYPYTLMSDTLKGFYKYITSGTDSAAIYINMKSFGSQVGGNYFLLPPSSAYSYFEIPMSAFMPPDTLLVEIYSASFPFSNLVDGSALYADELTLASLTTGIFNNTYAEESIFAYPNPFSDKLTLRQPTGIAPSGYFIYDSKGELVKTIHHTAGEFSTGDLAPGVYVIKVVSESKTYRQILIRR